MVTDGSYTGGEHSVIYKLVESICCTPETNVTLCVNYTQFFNLNFIKMGKGFEYIFLHRRFTNGKKHIKMLGIVSHQGNIKQNHKGIPLHRH